MPQQFLIQVDNKYWYYAVMCCVAQVLSGVPEGWSPGLVKPWEGGVVGVAYRTTPRRLGKGGSALIGLTLTKIGQGVFWSTGFQTGVIPL